MTIEIIQYLLGPEDAYLQPWAKDYYDKVNPVIFRDILEKNDLLGYYKALSQLLEDKSILYPEEHNVTIIYKTEDNGSVSDSDLEALDATIATVNKELNDTSLTGDNADMVSDSGGCHCIVC